MSQPAKNFDAFLSHSHEDAEWVEALAKRLEDECEFKIWLDKWTLVPGKSWQQGIAKGLNQAAACAACVGAKTPGGWFQEEVQRALDLQVNDPDFRVIPVLLPDGDPNLFPAFLSLRTWADFRDGQDPGYAFHVLKQGIKGEPPGRWPPKDDVPPKVTITKYEQKVIELRKLAVHLHEQVTIEIERKLMEKWLDEGEGP